MSDEFCPVCFYKRDDAGHEGVHDLFVSRFGPNGPNGTIVPTIPHIVPPGLPPIQETTPNAVTAILDSVFDAFAGPVSAAFNQICTFVEQAYKDAGEPLGEGMALLWLLSEVGKRAKEEKASE